MNSHSKIAPEKDSHHTKSFSKIYCQPNGKFILMSETLSAQKLIAIFDPNTELAYTRKLINSPKDIVIMKDKIFYTVDVVGLEDKPENPHAFSRIVRLPDAPEGTEAHYFHEFRKEDTADFSSPVLLGDNLFVGRYDKSTLITINTENLTAHRLMIDWKNYFDKALLKGLANGSLITQIIDPDNESKSTSSSSYDILLGVVNNIEKTIHWKNQDCSAPHAWDAIVELPETRQLVAACNITTESNNKMCYLYAYTLEEKGHTITPYNGVVTDIPNFHMRDAKALGGDVMVGYGISRHHEVDVHCYVTFTIDSYLIHPCKPNVKINDMAISSEAKTVCFATNNGLKLKSFQFLLENHNKKVAEDNAISAATARQRDEDQNSPPVQATPLIARGFMAPPRRNAWVTEPEPVEPPKPSTGCCIIS